MDFIGSLIFFLFGAFVGYGAGKADQRRKQKIDEETARQREAFYASKREEIKRNNNK